MDTYDGLVKVGTLSVRDIAMDVMGGKRGDGRAMPDLSERYEVAKLKEGGSGAPDLHRSGRLLSQLQIIEIGDDDSVTIGFNLSGGWGPAPMGGKGQSPEDIKKWRRLRKQKRDPLKLSKADIRRFAKEMVKSGMLTKENGPPPRKPRKRKRGRPRKRRR